MHFVVYQWLFIWFLLIFDIKYSISYWFHFWNIVTLQKKGWVLPFRTSTLETVSGFHWFLALYCFQLFNQRGLFCGIYNCFYSDFCYDWWVPFSIARSSRLIFSCDHVFWGEVFKLTGVWLNGRFNTRHATNKSWMGMLLTDKKVIFIFTL